MKKPILLFFAIFLFASNSFSQDNSWRSVEKSRISSENKLARASQINEHLLYSVDFIEMKKTLSAAPTRAGRSTSNVIVSFPNPEGEMQRFTMFEASVLESEIAARNPDIKTYVGKGIDDPSATISVSTTIFGLHAITHSGKNGTSYIDPYTKDLKNYVVYNKSQVSTTRSFQCGVIDEPTLENEGLELNASNLSRADNSLFKVYRLAMACTIEYAAYHVSAAGQSSGTLAQKKAAVLAAMAVTVTRVNSVYERDLAIRLVLINNNTDIINITSDTLDNQNTQNALLNSIQAYIDSVIGFTNYDIGHVVSTGEGGVASLGSPCTGIKAQGVTGLGAPVGDSYDIDFVAHEMGHQYGGSHTFNSVANSCGGNNRSSANAYEVGSGTTIQAYAGICAPENVQLNSDAYFHARSLIQMSAFINGTGNCGVITPNGNTPPVVNVNGNNIIPKGTPFVLTGSATDVDNPSGNQLTYCWEHYDRTSVSAPLLPTNTVGPNFRSIAPSASPVRYFPKLSSVVANNLAPAWEVLPTVARTLTFSLVVRDNGGPLGGQTQRATKTVTLADVGPFLVTSQSTAEAWAQNSAQNVTWNVAGTDANGINTTNVNIRLSTDGGLTFPTFLATNTANDGSESIIAPNLYSQTCRIMVEAIGNVYYALNTKNFYIGYAFVSNCNTYTNNLSSPITDNSGTLVKTFAIPATGIISDINVSVNVTHPNIGDLEIGFIKPGSLLQTLYSGQCLGNANLNVTFDSQAAAFACGNPTAGTYALPSGDFNASNGTTAAAGDWRIGFKDTVAGNVGTINSASIEVCSQSLVQLPPLANELFGFENFAMFPNPNNGNFTIKFDSGSNSKINIIVNDISGRKVYEKNYTNTGLFSESLQLDNAQKGIYLVTVKDGEKQIVKKIVIE